MRDPENIVPPLTLAGATWQSSRPIGLTYYPAR